MANTKSNSMENRASEAPPASMTGKVGQLIEKGEHRVQERAQKVRDALTELTVQNRGKERASASSADRGKGQQ